LGECGLLSALRSKEKQRRNAAALREKPVILCYRARIGLSMPATKSASAVESASGEATKSASAVEFASGEAATNRPTDVT
jgi:hypothetical protein